MLPVKSIQAIGKLTYFRLLVPEIGIEPLHCCPRPDWIGM